jgi:hypothetical protein
MRDRDSLTRAALVMVAAAGAAAAIACGPKEPSTDADRLARGREIVERMSGKLGSAPAFTVTTDEVRDEVKGNGTTQRVTLTRDTTVKRPDRLYTKVSGDRRTEIWYDGKGITVVLHNDKVFGQARAPETLDRTLDAIHERYGMSTPFADYAYSSPAKALLSDSTTGGWVGRETVAGQPYDHLSFKDKGVDWQIWIPSTGDPLPRKAIVEFTDDKRLRKIEMTFRDWNLSPPITDDRFSPKVPADYEGVAMLQRARVLRNVPADDTAATAGSTDKK